MRRIPKVQSPFSWGRAVRMCWIRSCLACAALSGNVGCGLVASATHNACNEYKLLCSERRFEREIHRLADEAWSRRSDALVASADFRSGYLDGFADYLRNGRTIESPPTPPNRYWRTAYQTPRRMAAANDYVAGFQQGAADALASGHREKVVAPVALACCGTPISPPAISGFQSGNVADPPNAAGESRQAPK